MPKKQKAVKSENYELFSIEELIERERQYGQRLTDINTSTGLIDDAIVEYKSVREEQLNEYKWNHYLSCIDLPDATSPPDIRLYLVKLRHFQDIDDDQTIDWTLYINERSVLSQDIFRKDLTRSALNQSHHPNIANLYDIGIDNCLKIIFDIERMFENENTISDVPLTLAADLILTKSEVEKEIENTTDRLVYRVISSKKSYMTTKDNIAAQYSYHGKNFNLQLWSLCNTPIRFNQLEIPAMSGNLDCIDVKVQMPLSVLDQNLTLCAVHYHFDHLSQYAKSFEQLITVSTEDLNDGITELFDCLINEWLTQLKIQREIRDKLVEKRRLYDELMALIAEKEAKAAKDKNSDDKKKIKIPRTPKEPPSIPEGYLPDTYNLFLERAAEQHHDFLDQFYHPNTLKLTPTEVNLREHVIIGGVYTMRFVRKPVQVDFDAVHRTLHEDQRKLYIYNDIIADIEHFKDSYTSEGLSVMRSRIDFNRSLYSLQERSHYQLQLKSDDAELPFFFVTFKLPKYLVLWGEPMACHYEESVDEYKEEVELTTEVFEELQPKVIKSNNNELITKLKSRKSVHRSLIPESSELSLNRVPGSVNAYRSKLATLLRLSKLADVDHKQVLTENFSLTTKLNKTKIRNIERFCLTRLISSFKFPQDMEDIKRREEEKTRKTGGPNIFRSRSMDEVDIVEEDYDFDYAFQDGPERLFPFFPQQEYPQYESEMDILCEPNTFCGVVHNLEKIRYEYTSDFKKMMNQNEVEYKDKSKKNIDENASLKNYLIEQPDFRFPAGKSITAAPKPIIEKNARSKLDRVRKSIKEADSMQKTKSNNKISNIKKKNFKSIRMEPIEKQKFFVDKKTQDRSKKKTLPKSKTSKIVNNVKSVRMDPKKCQEQEQLQKTVEHIEPKDNVNLTDYNDLYNYYQHEISSTDISDTEPYRISAGARSMKSASKASKDENTVQKSSQDEISVKDDYDAIETSSHTSTKENKEIRKSLSVSKIKHWTTKYIFQTHFNREQGTITIKTDRLGTFGFAFKRYDHFPFKYWSLKTNEDNPDEVELIIDTQHVRVCIYVSNKGFRSYVTDHVKGGYISKPVKYIDIPEPLPNFSDFKEEFCKKNLNIFGENDAGYYIKKGHFTQKHLACEFHTYGVMALHCKLLEFYISSWNRLATHRNVILCFKNPKDQIEKSLSTIRIEPEQASFVEIKELCSDDLDVYNLEYTPTWRNISVYSDLHQLINSMYVQATDERVRDPTLLVNVRQILIELRMFSFS